MIQKMNNGLFLSLFIGALGLGCSGSGTDDEVVPTDPEGITYEESLEVFPNPERGFYDHTEAHNPGDGLTPGQVGSLKAENVSLIIRVYYLSEYRDQAIDQAMLEMINNDMETVREAGIKAILRFAYTNEMDGEDAPLERVKGHIEQLAPVFNSNKDVIAFIQAGFIGPWGEWHNSSNGLTTVENEREVLFTLLEELSPDLLVQVRTPGAKQQIFETAEPIGETMAYTDEFRARVGHHNDCFMAGVDDYGTYGNIEAEKEYISQEALYVPTGGETCPPQGDYPDCTKAREEMELLRWTYLNRDYFIPVINGWKDAGCLDEFKRRLGYRLVLENAILPEEVKKGDNYLLQINMTNKGFAPLYKSKTTSVVLVSKADGEEFPFELAMDLREVKPGVSFAIEQEVDLSGIPAGNYDLFLEITDESEKLKDRVDYKIRLANKNSWDAVRGMNNLQHQVTVLAD